MIFKYSSAHLDGTLVVPADLMVQCAVCAEGYRFSQPIGDFASAAAHGLGVLW